MRIFISYKRGVSPDEALAVELHQRLSNAHAVFIDQAMAVGTPWAERIDRELRQADVLLLLLSAASVGSEMVAGEVETAQRLQKHQGRPRILPVRVAYRELLPYPLSAYLNPSPFNVGEVIPLDDFSAEQVADLNQRHGAPLAPGPLAQLMALLHGHPYLVRRALYLVAGGQMPVERVLEQAASDYGPFGDHLRYHLFRIVDNKALRAGLRQVIRSNRCDDEKTSRLLIAAGLARLEDGAVLPRCPLYATYFGEHLDG